MDFLDPKKKQAQKIRLYIGYALMAVALIIGSAILFFEARGFDLNRKTGEIVQNGLLFVDAHPEQATVYINGKQEAKTDARLAIPAGDYTVEFARDGYRTWKRTFTLIGSQIERLNYAFMFPTELQTTEIHPYAAAPTFATQSLDRKWLIVQQPGKLTSFDVLDLSNRDNPPVTSFALPEGVMTAATGSKLELVEWSTDNRRFIVRHTYTGGSEFILIDRERPAESLNLNKHFNIPVYKIAMRDKKFDKLHILDKNGGTLHFGDLKTKKLTTVATKVFSFKSYSDDVVFYVTSEKAKKDTVNVNIIKGRDNFKVRELPVGTNYPIDITRYDNEWYMAVSSNTDKRAYVYHEVFKDLEKDRSLLPTPVAVYRMKQNIDNITVSANTRFIGVQSGSEFAVYDADHDRRYQYDIKLKIAKGQKAKWMDGHRFATVAEGKLTVWDYDGINMQTLVSANPTFIPFFDRDYDYLYTIAPSVKAKGQSTVTKTPMRTQADL